MIRTIDGRKYIMRDQRSIKDIRRMYAAFIAKYSPVNLTFHQWMVEHGKVHGEIKPK